jgi:hypothetical protein
MERAPTLCPNSQSIFQCFLSTFRKFRGDDDLRLTVFEPAKPDILGIAGKMIKDNLPSYLGILFTSRRAASEPPAVGAGIG